jgi:hypothetical protein
MAMGEALAVRSRVLLVLVTAVFVCAIMASGLLVRVDIIEGAPAQTPWQYLGPATTANP